MSSTSTTPGRAGDARPPGPERGRGFRPDVEGLRAVAIVLVLLFTAGVPAFGSGFTGVDVFFVISGYLITGLLVREVEATGTVSLAAFYARRARRILPSAYTVLLVVLLVTVVVAGAAQQRAVARDVLAAALQAANLWFLTFDVTTVAPAVAESPVLHYWSLAVEEQFYLVWPLVVLGVAALAARRGRDVRRSLVVAIVTLSLVSGVLYLWWSSSAFQASYFASPARAWQLGAGALVALLGPALRRLDERTGGRVLARLLAGAGVVALLLVPVGNAVGVFAAAAAATAGAAAVIAAGGLAGGPRTLVARLLSLRPVRFVGRLSFTWYLWHVPLVVAFERSGVTSWPVLLGAELLAAVPALLTMRFVEEPLRGAPRLRSPRAGLLFGAAGAVVVAAPALALGL
ncbi:acyltransferase family protein [Kineococcus rubinsiae]|uniref:acyltransferase family protein n=1 Tax=Kineococcus rubinsiae TaxID=2609562 RepID=UPI00143079B0|nr:acyltransferase [Kineococcus rubinsiae]NIZ92850.1 acyltransferase [Kineococcus rubinsiae]